jgi:hypothetical protein
MAETTPERRRRAAEALGGYRAAMRARETGEDFDAVLPGCIAAVTGREIDAIIAVADTAPPPETWDPERRRAIQRAIRQADRRLSEGR